MGSVGLTRVVLEDVLLEELALVSVPAFTFGLSEGSVPLAGAAIPGVAVGVPSVFWPVTERPVLPWISSVLGSRPRGDPFFNPSTPRICGKSSRLTGFTNWAVTMNINSVSFFWNDLERNSEPSTGISPSTGTFERVLDSLL